MGNMLLVKYEQLKNYVCHLYAQLQVNKRYDFYFRTLMIFTTFLAYMMGYVTATLMNTLYFLNLFVTSIKHMSQVNSKQDNNESSNMVIKNWITYSVVVIFNYVFDIITNFIGFKIFSDFANIVLHYNLFKSSVLSNDVNKSVQAIYETNKTGIETVQSGAIHTTQIIVDSFGTDYVDELKTIFHDKMKRKTN